MPTCSSCKKRKVKCDGKIPVCGSCAHRGRSSPCDYRTTRQHPPAEFLPRGDACIPCRRKKKKCNGERPACHTCIVAKKDKGCVYNDNSPPNVFTALVELEKLLGTVSQWPTTSESPSHPKSADTEPSSTFQNEITIPTAQIGPSPPNSVWFPSDPAAVIFAPPVPSSYEGAAISPNFTMTSSTSTVPSASRTMTAPAPSKEPVAVPAALTTELVDPQQDYMDLHTVFMQSGIVLGQSSTRQKWQAVHMGDTSWNVVHPALIHVAQLFGARILNRSRPHAPPIDEEPLLNYALLLINSMPPLTIPDAITHIQCYGLLSVHFLKTPDISVGREWLLKADITIRQFDLHIQIPPKNTPKPDVVSTQIADGQDCPFRLLIAQDEEDEKRDALCQLLYIDSACSLRNRLPTVISPQLRQEFEILLTHFLTRMREASMVVIRMSSIAFLQEARAVMVGGLNAGTPSLSFTCSVPSPFSSTIRRIHLYLADLNELLLATPPTQEDRPRCLMLQQCTLVAATALASIYQTLSPGHPELQSKCIDAIADIVGISDRLSPEDCGQLDPIITVCWSIALNISVGIQYQISEKCLQGGGNYSGIQKGQVPAFIEVLKSCGQKVKWSFPLSGGMALDM